MKVPGLAMCFTLMLGILSAMLEANQNNSTPLMMRGAVLHYLRHSAQANPSRKFKMEEVARYASKQILVMLAHVRRVAWNKKKWQEATRRALADVVHKVQQLVGLAARVYTDGDEDEPIEASPKQRGP